MFDLSTAKIVSSRDSATAALRKLGTAKTDYDNFIVKQNGKYYVDIVGATAPKTEPAEETSTEPVATGNPFAALIKTSKPEADERVAKVTKTKAPKTEKQPKTKPAPVKVEKVKAPKVKAEKQPKPPKTSVSSIIRDMILAGQSNQQIYDQLLADGTLTENKKHYPSWYRCELRRAGHQGI